MVPGDVIYPVVLVADATTGAAVTGLVTGNFSVDYYLDTTTPSAAFTVTEIGSGYYRVNATLPATAGYLNIFISSAGTVVTPDQWAGEIEGQDADSIFAVVVRPLSQLAGASELASEVPLVLNAYRYKSLSVSVVDQNGDPIDLSGYNNWTFNVWDQTHTGSVYTLASGITGSALGVVAWAVPEDAAFFSFIDTAIAAGNNTATLYYDMLADEAATATKTATVFRGTLTLTRFEGPN